MRAVRHPVTITWRLIWELVKAKFGGRVLWFEIAVEPITDEDGVVYTAHYIEGRRRDGKDKS